MASCPTSFLVAGDDDAKLIRRSSSCGRAPIGNASVSRLFIHSHSSKYRFILFFLALIHSLILFLSFSLVSIRLASCPTSFLVAGDDDAKLIRRSSSCGRAPIGNASVNRLFLLSHSF